MFDLYLRGFYDPVFHCDVVIVLEWATFIWFNYFKVSFNAQQLTRVNPWSLMRPEETTPR